MISFCCYQAYEYRWEYVNIPYKISILIAISLEGRSFPGFLILWGSSRKKTRGKSSETQGLRRGPGREVRR
jgi:hypothetical protein